MREIKGLHDDNLRPLLLTHDDDLPPCYEEVDQMGIDQTGHFFFIQRGLGGGLRGIVCGLDDTHCTGKCFKDTALYFTPDGKPLFFCRYFYTIFKGEKYVDEETPAKALQAKLQAELRTIMDKSDEARS